MKAAAQSSSSSSSAAAAGAGAAVPQPQRAAARKAVDRGLAFLEASLRADGAWKSQRYANLELRGEPVAPEYAPFVSALGALTLETSDDPRARSIRARSAEFIIRSMSYPGTWRYWPHLPRDLDSLSLCSQAAAWHPWVLFGRNLALLPAAQDEQGRFRTWLAAPGESNPPDSVVNANVVGYLAAQGRHDLGERAAAWLAGLVRDGSADGTSHYYPDAIDLYDAMARARALGAPGLQAVGPALVERLRARRAADGGYGDTLRTARALSALQILGAAPAGAELAATLERILSRQRADGGWPEHCYWRGALPPPPPTVGFGSEMLDTASCVEALLRSGAAR